MQSTANSIGVVVACSAAALLTSSTAFALTQPDQTTIPVINTSVTDCTGGNVQVCLNAEEGGQTIDAQAAAAVTPETYTPGCALTFRVLARGAGFMNTFGWYNVNPSGKPADTDLHSFLECSDGVGTTKDLDIKASPYYTGGLIGFFMATPEGASGNCPTFNAGGGPVAGTVGYIYYSEAKYNPDNTGPNSFIHLITYNSITYPNSFYFAWEDLLSGGDNDFDDLLTRVSGITCSGGGATCDTGFDGKCKFGTMQCRNGALQCIQNEQKGTEACNAVDDDCNGSTDDGDLCESDEVCFQGKCVPKCGTGEFQCNTGTVCNSAGVCVEPACRTVTCAEGKVCVGGQCVGACDGVTCPYGQVCRVGVCVDPCSTITCDGDYVCDQGVCVLKCDCASCTSGKVCDTTSKVCVETGCEGKTCSTGQHCVTGGTCADNCSGAECPHGQMCSQGKCVTDPDAGAGGTAGSGGSHADGGFIMDGSAGTGGKYDASIAPDGSATEGGDQPDGDDGGCGCRVGERPTRFGLLWVALGAIGAAFLARHRRRV